MTTLPRQNVRTIPLSEAKLPRRTLTFTLPRIGKRVVKIIGVVVVGLVLLGLGAMMGQQTNTPDANTVSVLRYAQAHSVTPCYAVWSVGAKTWAVKCGQLH